MPRVFLAVCAASFGTRCARLYGGTLYFGSAYGAIDFLCAGREFHILSRVPSGSQIFFGVRNVFSTRLRLLRLNGIQQFMCPECNRCSLTSGQGGDNPVGRVHDPQRVSSGSLMLQAGISETKEV